MNEEPTFRLIMSILFTIWFGYYALLAWVYPHSFRRMAEKSLPLYGNSSAMKEWMHSQSFLWLARVGTLFFSIVWGIVLVISIWSLISSL